MKCPRCQSDNRQGARFCLQCGEKLEQSCSQCGTFMEPSARFCDECGHPLAGPTPSPSAGYSKPRSERPQSLGEQILTDGISAEGERKWVTVLFVDVVNYTSLSERLDPEEIHRVMDQWVKVLTDEIHRYGGTVTQFTGDGVMALFGAPVAHEDHAQRACHAALSIHHAMVKHRESVRLDCQVDLTLRVGIHSGLAIVGSIGEDLCMDYTAMGDTTNLASRMEKLSPPGSILVSGETYRMTRDFFQFRPMGRISVKGKEAPLEAYELVGTGEVKTRIEAAVVRGLTEFVGRESELNGLQKAFQRARSGAGQVIGMVGEAGAGKSRLVLEFKRVMGDGGYTYLEGRCLHHGNSVAYLPMLDLLRSYFNVEGFREYVVKKRIEERIDELDPNLHHLLPPLYELLSLTVEDEGYLKLEPRQKRERIFEALRDLLIRESQRNPLILVIEDLHWIDKTSQEFLTYLIGWLASAPILLILLYRPEFTHPWENKSYYSRIGLGDLPAEARKELVEALLHGEGASPELQQLIGSKAGGNPLFMEELTRALVQRGDVERGEQGYVLTKGMREIQVPDTIQGIITARMDRLQEDLKQTLQVASVIGKNFAFSILETILGMKKEIKPDLLELQGLELIYEKSLFPEIQYEFKHALVHEVAYTSLLLRRRREIHEKVARAIERLYSDRIKEFYELLAYHYGRGEGAEKAYQYLKLSGIKASQSSSLWEAYRFFREAIRLLNQTPSTEESRKEQIAVRLLMASPMISLGFPEDSLQVLKEGETLSREMGATKSLITFCSIIGLHASVKGDPVAGLNYGEECFAIAEQSQDIELMAPVAFDLCSNYAATGIFLKVVDLAPGILLRLEQTKRERECFDRGYSIYSALSAFCGFCEGYLGHFKQARILCEQALRVALETKNLHSLGLAETLFGYLHCTKGDGQEALLHFQRGIDSLQRGQIFVLLGLAQSGLGWAHYFMDHLEIARTQIEKGLKLHLDAGVSYDLSVHYWFLAAVHCDLGEWERAQRYVEEALSLARKNNEVYVEGISRIILGRILARKNLSQPGEARAAILKGIHILEELKIKTLCGVGHLSLAELYAQTGQEEEALGSLRTAKGIFQETGMDYWIDRANALAMAPS